MEGATVKPLIWTQPRPPFDRTEIAETIIGLYGVMLWPGTGEGGDWCWSLHDGIATPRGFEATIDAAKAAAEIDYRTRILSALEESSFVESVEDRELTAEDHALIERATAAMKARLPVARVINDNQPGKQAIVEVLRNPPTLPVGTMLFVDAAPVFAVSDGVACQAAPLTRAQISAAIAAFRQHGIDFPAPWDGDLDDVEGERFDALCSALYAAFHATFGKEAHQ